MTKKEQLKKEVTEAWDELNMTASAWGSDNEHTLRARAKWYGLDRAWNIMYPDECY